MHPIENIIETSMEKIKHMVDVNTVVGSPVSAGDGTLILPVSKVSLGFILGGGEYGSLNGTKKAAAEAGLKASDGSSLGERFPFAGVTAVGMCLKPTAFVTVEQGNVRVLHAAAGCAVDRLTDMVPQVLKSLDKLASSAMECLKKKLDAAEAGRCCESDGNAAESAGACCKNAADFGAGRSQQRQKNTADYGFSTDSDYMAGDAM